MYCRDGISTAVQARLSHLSLFFQARTHSHNGATKKRTSLIFSHIPFVAVTDIQARKKSNVERPKRSQTKRADRLYLQKIDYSNDSTKRK